MHASGNAFGPIFNGAFNIFNVKLEGEYDALLQFVGGFHSKPNAIKAATKLGDESFPSIYGPMVIFLGTVEPYIW